MGDISDCDSLDELQQIVDSGVWRNRPELINQILRRYTDLTSSGHRSTGFGNSAFWCAIQNGVDRDNDDEPGGSRPITIGELQEQVESGIWEYNTKLRDQFFERYLQLSRGQYHTNFGTQAFWNSLFDSDEDVGVPVQRGQGVEDDREESPVPEVIEIVPSNFYELKPMFKKSSKRFGTNYGQYDLQFKNMENAKDIELALLAIFTEVLEKLKEGDTDDDLIGFFLDHPALNIPIVIPLRRMSQMTAEVIVEYIMRVLQSKKILTFDEAMQVYFTRIKRPSGAGRVERRYITNHEEYLKKKRAIIEITNNDDLCCARAIVTAKARVDEDRFETVRKGDRNRNVLQRSRAIELMQRAGLQDHQGACGPEEWMALQRALGEGQYQLKIFDKDMFNGLIYVGSDAPKVLHLWLCNNEHFHVVTSPAAFFERKFYCESCNKAYERRTDHQICPVKCHFCFAQGKCIQHRPLKKCETCHRFFNNDQCFQNHLKGGVNKKNKKQEIIPVCNLLRRCPTCNKEYYTRKGHQCGVRKCRTCKVDVHGDSEHKCFIQPYTKKSGKGNEDEALDDSNNLIEEDVIEEEEKEEGDDCTGEPPRKKVKQEERTTFIFYDFECRQDDKVGETLDGNDINLHKPNLVVAHKVCEDCCDKATLEPCQYCKDNRRVFEGPNTLNDFCRWLFSRPNKDAIAIAHNSKGYDCQFILDYCHQAGLRPKHIISRGLSLMYLEVGSIRFKDSLNFLPMALAALPKAFDIPECKKGYFPHMFNRRENWDYVGAWPDKDYYQPDSMKDGAREKFLQWYDQQKDKEFNFRREILEYCESDVTVLRRCCIKFRQMFLEIGQIDPFVESITIASVCNKYYRKQHMPPDQIAVVPHGGYRKEENQSIIALKWLKWMAHTTNQRIRHKLNGGEVNVGPWRVDGISGTTIFEFYGCYWHGCRTCMAKRNRTTADGEMTASEAFQKTAERRRCLESMGYTVEEKWECELRQELKDDPIMAEFFKNVAIVEPLDAREAFFGGRTNATVLHRKVTDGEKIKYIDVLSLYPYVCKYGRFPLGHPEIITEDFAIMDANNMPYEGLIKCKVLPPRNLLHPVLPIRSNSKLLFPLCKECASTCQQEECHHSAEERALSGAWVSLELKKALELGYRILEVYEVWHYKDFEQYDREDNPNGGLFSSYINEFLRIKQESDGWPEDADTDEKKQAFLNEWKRREGIELRPEKMLKNAGLRALAKLCLNSFWGKFGQRSKMGKTEYFTEPSDFFKLVFDPAVEAKTVRIVNDKMVSVQYEMLDEFVEVLANTNTVIAAYTTAQARLKLYSYLEQLQERVMYFDTDSIIYHEGPLDMYQPPIGNYLGEMTDELEKDYGVGSYIIEFVSGGPKHYAYKVRANDGSETVCMKVKGFKITHDLSADINFECLKEKVLAFVTNKDRQETTVHIQRIERNADRQVLTVIRKKVYRVTYDKRIVRNDFSTIPYGYALEA